ncbi:class I SAM-dependent RNA methyltransferase [Hamadaea tsunoensis]|uniref:class I SAM-dependent RNA methyltransferase n=1 Tax=Hamadaea tsunoensis TaxID=53368 RepID=UPI00041FA8D6|nr:TRAM domain-containing protein [Hamadaea tsunoensis]
MSAIPQTLTERERIEVTVGEVAHGGHCVARHEGVVIFVRHALPGERVVAEITELHPGYARAEAVEILSAAPDRVTPPCRWSGPNACGGCDLQHVSEPGQLAWKEAVVREQLARLAHLPDHPVRVEQLPVPGSAGERSRETPEVHSADPGWRTRVRYTVDAADRPGLRKHRSHEVVPIDECMIAHPAIRALPVLGRTWPGVEAVETVAPSDGSALIIEDPAAKIVEHVAGRDFTIAASGFWQVHPAAAQTLVDAVLAQLEPKPGETAWDLYGGAGLFAAAVGSAVGVTGNVTLVEAAADGVAAARANLADLPVRVVQSTVEHALSPRRSKRPGRGGGGGGKMPLRGGAAQVQGPVDVVVLDPPRTGAGKKVVDAIVAAQPRAVSYVACDPAALARDIDFFQTHGWRLAQLRAFDCFPFTHHVECVALLTP